MWAGKRARAARAGVLMSSWLGGLLLQVGEWIIKKLPLVKHIYSAAKQARTPSPPRPSFTCTTCHSVRIRHAAQAGTPRLRPSEDLPPMHRQRQKCRPCRMGRLHGVPGHHHDTSLPNSRDVFGARLNSCWVYTAPFVAPARARRRAPAARPAMLTQIPLAEQVSAAVNPANEGSQSFQECVLIRHPRHGEFAFGFITGSTSLQARAHAVLLVHVGGEALCSMSGAHCT